MEVCFIFELVQGLKGIVRASQRQDLGSQIPFWMKQPASLPLKSAYRLA